MTKLIAEIGWNHMGDMKLAKKMILAAKESGCDFAKFQTWSVSRLKRGSWDTDGRREIYENAELSFDKHIELKEYCDKVGIGFMSNVFSIEDAKLLKNVVKDYVKIPSFESRNTELIHYCLKHFKHLLISTGTSTFNEMRSIVVNIPHDKYTLLHCVSSYPCDFNIVNLPRMNTLKQLSNSVGFSDHAHGIESAVLSLGMGVDFIEKHFTTDNDLPGRDNKFAVLPSDMKRLSDYIKISEKVLDDKGMNFQDCELDSRNNYTGRFNG